jgi:hypothetical protein
MRRASEPSHENERADETDHKQVPPEERRRQCKGEVAVDETSLELTLHHLGLETSRWRPLALSPTILREVMNGVSIL